MAKGFGTARDAFAEIEARKNSGGGGGGLYLKLPKSGDSAVVRLAVKEPDWLWVHDLPKPAGQNYQKVEACRDQDLETGARNGEPCPGCDKEYRRKMQGTIPLIWRDAPVYEEVDDGRGNKKKNYENVVGYEDQVVKWTVGKVILEELDGKAATYKDLTSRDFKITRSGTGLDTTYNIEPVVNEEGDPVKTPLSENDVKLIEEAPKIEFKIPSFNEWNKSGSNKGESSAPSSAADPSPFRKRQE
jgi:hypothetical protein